MLYTCYRLSNDAPDTEPTLREIDSSITSFLRDYFTVIKMDFEICQILNLSIDMII